MLERERACNELAEVVLRARAGTGGSGFLIGDAGIGKTTVLEHVLHDAREHALVAAAAADPIETVLPFSLAEAALRGLEVHDLDWHGDRDILSGPKRGALYQSVMNRLERVASQPLVIGLDDIQWADPESVALLSYVTRRIGNLPIAIIGATRVWPPAAEEMIRRLSYRGMAHMVHLVALSDAGARALLRVTACRSIPRTLMAEALHLCAGNPLLLQQLGLAIRNGDLPPEADGGWLPRNVNVLLLARFACLSESAVRCAQAGSILGARFRVDVAAEAAGLHEAEAATALHALDRAGLVRFLGGNWASFVHPLVQDALRADLAPTLRQTLHANTVRVLLRRRLDHEAAEQALRGGLVGNREAITALRTVGRQELTRGDLDAAAEHLQAAVDLSEESPSPQLLIALAESLLFSGHPSQAARACNHLLTQGMRPAAHAAAMRILGRAAEAMGEGERATSYLHDAATLAEGYAPTTGARALLDLALVTWPRGGIGRALDRLARAEEVTRDHPEPTTRRSIDCAKGFLCFLQGDPAGLAALSLAVDEISRATPPDVGALAWSWSPMRLYADALRWAERFAEAENVTVDAMAAAARCGAWEAVGALALCSADTLTRLGSLTEALAAVGKALELSELVRALEPPAQARRALILLHLDKLDESSAACRAAESAASTPEDAVTTMWVHHVRGQMALRGGDPDNAAAHYAALASIARDQVGIQEPCVVPWFRHGVAAAMAAGDVDRVIAYLEDLELAAQRVGCRWPRMVLALGRARCEEHLGDLAAAERHYIEAVALSQHLQLPLERIETLIDYGAFLRRTGHSVRARSYLAEALEHAERSGAHWLARHARDELAVAGGRRRPRNMHERDLTPQERRVAALAAKGHSNKDIARALSISLRTVGSHLESVYAKLGITSRRQLMLMHAKDVEAKETVTA